MTQASDDPIPERRNHVGRRSSELWQRLIGVALGTLLVLPVPARADDAADGRRHAERASHLSASGKCRQAIGEYDKAIAVLHDPALLFNRGECHRRLGNGEAALEDYNQFLTDLPSAPNRAQVEARIVELKNAPRPSTATISAQADHGSASSAQSGTNRGSASGAASGAFDATRAPGAVPGAANGQGASNSLLLARPQPADEPQPFIKSEDSLASRPWFWVAIGAAVVGAGVAAFVVLDRPGTSVPQSDLGNYKF
jgi:tetratricopeptide (TPR) repeat protein